MFSYGVCDANCVLRAHLQLSVSRFYRYKDIIRSPREGYSVWAFDELSVIFMNLVITYLIGYGSVVDLLLSTRHNDDWLMMGHTVS